VYDWLKGLQGPAPRDEVFRSGDPEILDELSFMFPNASQTLPASSMSFSTNTYLTEHLAHQPMMYAQRQTSQGNNYPEMAQAVFHANVPQRPPHPIRTRSLPCQIYSSSMTHLTPQISPSSQSPQPQSPVTPHFATAKSTTLPKPNEPQIRYNEKCFNYRIEKNKSIPLDPTSFGKYVVIRVYYSCVPLPIQ
jgi:hypothetical protein